MSYIDLEDQDLINADENELYVEEEGLEPNNDANYDNNEDNPDATDLNTAPNAAAKVAPKKRIVKNPQPKLNPERLKGPKGLITIESWFKDIQLKGKGHEKEDLNAVLSRLELWTHQLFPKYTFDDMLKKIETLGHKSQVMNYVRRIRMGIEDENMVSRADDIIDDDDEPTRAPDIDPFDTLLNANPPSPTNQNQTQPQIQQSQQNTLTEEQRQRITRNRLIAEERRLARMKARQEELARQEDERTQQREELSQDDETMLAAMDMGELTNN